MEINVIIRQFPSHDFLYVLFAVLSVASTLYVYAVLYRDIDGKIDEAVVLQRIYAKILPLL